MHLILCLTTETLKWGQWLSEAVEALGKTENSPLCLNILWDLNMALEYRALSFQKHVSSLRNVDMSQANYHQKVILIILTSFFP